MATTLEGRRLTDAHRVTQARLGARTVISMRAIWPLLDPASLDRSYQRWLTAALPIIQGQRATSARLAANYTTAFKLLEVGERAPVVLAEAVSPEALATSLWVTGPVQLRRALRNGVPYGRAVSMAQATSASSAMRHVLNGGRETIAEMVGADRQAIGWARATSGKTCSFCALLASRGAVYSERTVRFESHDHCNCNAEPIYDETSALPPGSERYADLYQQAKAADGDTLAEFRRLVAA